MGTRSRLTLARARASAMRYSPTAARAHYSYSIFYIEYSIVTSCSASEVNYSDATMASSSSSTSDQGPSWKDESERVFSLLQVMFNDRQGLALQDYIESSLMLQYNGR